MALNLQFINSMASFNHPYHSFFKKRLYLILDGGEEREKERERNINVWLYLCGPIGDLACNPGTCPDWELNQ